MCIATASSHLTMCTKCSVPCKRDSKEYSEGAAEWDSDNQCVYSWIVTAGRPCSWLWQSQWKSFIITDWFKGACNFVTGQLCCHVGVNSFLKVDLYPPKHKNSRCQQICMHILKFIDRGKDFLFSLHFSLSWFAVGTGDAHPFPGRLHCLPGRSCLFWSITVWDPDG